MEGLRRARERDFPLGGRGCIAEKCQENIPAGRQTYGGLEPEFYGLIKFITVINPGSKYNNGSVVLKKKKKTTQSNMSIFDGGGGVEVWND